MYKTFEISNFRCFTEFKLSSLKTINLLAGKNGSGKTSLLEALFLFSARNNPTLALVVNDKRGIESINLKPVVSEDGPFELIFKDFNTSGSILFKATLKNGTTRAVKFKVVTDIKDINRAHNFLAKEGYDSSAVMETLESGKVLELSHKTGAKKGSYYLVFSKTRSRVVPGMPNPDFLTFFLTHQHPDYEALAQQFGQLVVDKKSKNIVRILNIIDPRLKNIEAVPQANHTILYGDIGAPKLTPLPLLGNGIMMLANYALTIYSAPGGVVLIDEIENGLHHSILGKVWSALAKAAKENNTQLFATTHSLECIKAAHRAFAKDKNYDFQLIRLDRKEQEVKPVVLDREIIETAIEANWEIR